MSFTSWFQCKSPTGWRFCTGEEEEESAPLWRQCTWGSSALVGRVVFGYTLYIGRYITDSWPLRFMHSWALLNRHYVVHLLCLSLHYMHEPSITHPQSQQAWSLYPALSSYLRFTLLCVAAGNAAIPATTLSKNARLCGNVQGFHSLWMVHPGM